MPSNTLALRTPVDPAALRPLVDQLLVLVVLVLVLGLATLLPGGDRTLPRTAVSVRGFVIALGTVAVVLWLGHAARTVAALVPALVEGPDALVADASRAAAALVVFLAVLVAYRGFAGVVVPRLAAGGAAWAYDAAFLALALVPLAVVARRLLRNVDVVAGHVAEMVAARIANGDRRTEV